MNDRMTEEIRQYIAQQIELGDDLWPLPDPHVQELKGPPAHSDQPPQNTLRETLPITSDQPAWDGLSLDAFREAICRCQACPLGATRTKFVFGEGDPDADLMFIGEAPGADEDAQGIPFVGRSGQLLTKMIEAMGFARDQVFIANVLKCRPPNNRDPQADEVAKCEPYLKHQISLIKPKIICTLGLISAQTLLGSTESLGALRKRVHSYEGTALHVTYHPAYLLRDPRKKRDAWEDLKKIRFELDGTEL